MTTIMKPDWNKLKREIHATVGLQRNVGNDAYLCDLALYATYLYCVASQFRGHLHMRQWNHLNPHKMEDGRSNNPRLFQYTINNLDDQKQFIEKTREFILHRQDWMKKYNIQSVLRNLPVDFIKEVTINESGTTIA